MKVRNILVGLLAMSGSSAPSRTTASASPHSVKGQGSAIAPLNSNRGSAQGLGSLRSGCKTGGVEDKEGVPVLGAVK